MLEAACMEADEVVIGVGSANVIDARNPYTANEREMMLEKSLSDKGISNYRFVQIPDFHDDKSWVNYIQNVAEVDQDTTILSGNPWVAQAFSSRGYETQKPEEVISGDLVDISATRLRNMILNGDETWREYAASGTVEYFEQFGGAERIAKFYQLAAK